MVISIEQCERSSVETLNGDKLYGRDKQNNSKQDS